MYEYKVIPAPDRGEKSRNVKTPEGRFALSIEAALNEMAKSGWEFQRAETLPSSERRGFTGSTTQMRSLLVFRRALAGDSAQFQPRDLDGPAAMVAPSVTSPEGAMPRLVAGAERGHDNGVRKSAASPSVTGGANPRADERRDPILTAPGTNQGG